MLSLTIGGAENAAARDGTLIWQNPGVRRTSLGTNPGRADRISNRISAGARFRGSACGCDYETLIKYDHNVEYTPSPE